MEFIALSGPMYSGKTTQARKLAEKHGYLWIRFNDTLKVEAMIALQAVGISTTINHMLEHKKRYRGFLQELGVLLDFDHNPEWVIKSLREWFDLGRPKAVFDNVRTVDQYLTLKPYGFELVEMRLPFVEQYSRASRLGVSREELERMWEHPIEKGLQQPELVSMYLDATEPPEMNAKFLTGELAADTHTAYTRKDTAIALPDRPTQKEYSVQKHLAS